MRDIDQIRAEMFAVRVRAITVKAERPRRHWEIDGLRRMYWALRRELRRAKLTAEAVAEVEE
jgi:hypothetical protein